MKKPEYCLQTLKYNENKQYMAYLLFNFPIFLPLFHPYLLYSSSTQSTLESNLSTCYASGTVLIMFCMLYVDYFTYFSQLTYERGTFNHYFSI